MRKLLALSTFAIALSASSAFAMDGPDHDIFLFKSNAEAMETVDMMDANADGMISKDEYSMAIAAKAGLKASAQYDAMDEDGDGMMMKEEVVKFFDRIDK